ncbi:hypothetical protein HYH03_017697 [Edaphochlamys debaryana]|uniref:FIST domain-containing protein n=1 Tax=Edaphochlamys debaryana TaxID=47281 RepID=A0A835XIK0_9CHLO|nr:hypothetical protein HYH03_017697 [Edaphochlamys debaryana]|eukprot:KAG2483443.1 hypothetical protein HYH03_017697 [Edaphochlamys debaryana]
MGRLAGRRLLSSIAADDAGVCGGAPAFVFASAAAVGRSPLAVARQLADTVKQTLRSGQPPHLLALFASPHPEWGTGLAELPQYVRQLLTCDGTHAPTLVGGALRAVSGGPSPSREGLREGGGAAALLAAHLPGVALRSFHTDQGSLPALGGAPGGWGEVVRAARESAAAAAAAASASAAHVAGRSRSGFGFGGWGATQAWQQRGIVSESGAGSGAAAGPGPGPGSGGAGGAGGEGAQRQEAVAALVLSTPHFLAIEELLRRFGSVAPGMQVVGGVTSPGAWGESESSFGAVFLNGRAYAQGAVGVVMQGPLKLDSLLTPGFRGAGPLLRATGVEGNTVWEVDGEPVQRPLQRAMSQALTTGEFATALKIGVGDGSAAAGGIAAPPPPAPLPAPHAPAPGPVPGPAAPPPHLVTRNWFFQQGPPRPLMTVGTAEPIAPGTALQVHLQNFPAAHREMRDRLRAYARALAPPPPPAAGTAGAGAAAGAGAGAGAWTGANPSPGKSVGALALSCSSLPFFEGSDVERCLPRAAFVGGKVEGEFGSTVEGAPARLHSFSSGLVFIRAADAPDGA